MSKKFVVSIMIIVGILLLGYIVVYPKLKLLLQSARTPTAAPMQQTAVEQKVGDTSKTGILVQKGSQYFLQDAQQNLLPLDSYSYDLAQYVGKTVTVTGQYSGDTLFVGKLQE